jgi:argininosuccinate synthase
MSLTLADLKKEKVGACVSGGLDSRTISKRMIEEGVTVLAFAADLGQPDEKDIQDIHARMAPCGVDTVIVDLKEAMAQACFEVLEAQAMYDGGYWNSTGIARAVTVRGLLAFPSVQAEKACQRPAVALSVTCWPTV